MLTDWTSIATKGEPVFVRDGDNLSIICDPGERGIWFSTCPVAHLTDLLFIGAWNTGLVRIVWFYGGNEIGSCTPQDLDEIEVPENADACRVNCILSGEGTAYFEGVQLLDNTEPEPEAPYLPVPPPDMAQKHHVTGWKWASNIMLYVHEAQASADPHAPATAELEQFLNSFPPDYGAPYAVTGFQHGRRLDLEIGNAFVDPDDEGE